MSPLVGWGPFLSTIQRFVHFFFSTKKGSGCPHYLFSGPALFGSLRLCKGAESNPTHPPLSATYISYVTTPALNLRIHAIIHSYVIWEWGYKVVHTVLYMQYLQYITSYSGERKMGCSFFLLFSFSLITGFNNNNK